MTRNILWYTSSASEWTDALPLGNGRLGAMVYGGTTREELQLNEDTLWSGGPYAPSDPDALKHLGAVRELVFAGRYVEAEKLADAHLMGRPYLQMSYQPAGHGEAGGSALHYRGRNRAENGVPGKLRWCFGARVVTDGGAVTADGEQLRITGATSATLLVDIATSYRRFDDVSGDPEALSAGRLDTAQRKGREALRADHITAHRALFDRFDIELRSTSAQDLPTSARIEQFA